MLYGDFIQHFCKVCLHPVLRCVLRGGGQVEDLWYEVQDLRVTDILPQMVALSESYWQLYELQQH